MRVERGSRNRKGKRLFLESRLEAYFSFNENSWAVSLGSAAGFGPQLAIQPAKPSKAPKT